MSSHLHVHVRVSVLKSQFTFEYMYIVYTCTSMHACACFPTTPISPCIVVLISLSSGCTGGGEESCSGGKRGVIGQLPAASADREGAARKQEKSKCS